MDLQEKLEKIAEERAKQYAEELSGYYDWHLIMETHLNGFQSATDLLLPLLEEAIEALDKVEGYYYRDAINHPVEVFVRQKLNSINEKLETLTK